MQNSIVLILWNAQELAVIDLRVHYAVVVQFFHCRRNAKTATTS